MRWRRLVVPVLLLVVLLTGGAITQRLLFSEQGLHALLARLQALDAVHVEVEGARGVLAGPLSAERVIVDHAAVRIEARGVRVDPTLGGLLSGLVTLEALEVDGVDVRLKKVADKPPTEPRFLPRFLRIAAPGLVVHDASVTLANGQVLQAASLRGDLRMNRWRVEMDRFAIEDPAGRIGGELALRASRPLGLRVAASGHWRLPDERVYHFGMQARGDLDRLATELELTEPARLSFSGTALALTGAAHLVGTVRTSDFDGSPWVPAGRLPRVTGAVALDVRLDAYGIDGTFTSPDFGDEPLRIQGAARRSGRQVEIDSLRAWLPHSETALSVSGSVRVDGGAPVLELAGDWTALRWPIAGEPVVDSPLGVFELAGPLPYTFEVKALARGPQLPESDLTARGSFDRAQLLLDRIDAFVLRGRLAGSGRLSWAGGQAWSAAFDGTALDIAGLRPDLSGRVDLTGTIAGQGYSATASWTARVDSLSGTLLGRSLTGQGQVSHRDGSYTLERVRVANGPSHVDIDGTWGPTVNLRWNADVRSLAVLGPGIAGELATSGEARGPQDRPHVVADARVRRLRYRDWSVESSDASVDVDFSGRRDSRIELRATDIDTGGLPVESVLVRAHGRIAEHDIGIEVSVPPNEQRRFPGFEAALSAAGGANLRGRSWSGSLASATMLFPDGRAQLIQPVAIDLGPTLVKSAPLCLATGEARLCAEGEWHDSPRAWRVIYSAQDWPLKRLLTSLLGRREFDGKLQASGWAQQEPGREWIGGTTLLLDNPTVDIPRNKFRTQRFDLGRGQLDLFADADAIRITTGLQMAESTRVNAQATIVRTRGQALADHPMSGQLVAESAVLSALPLVVPEIDRSEGRLDAAVNIGGRVGAPQFEGEFHLKDGRFDLYRTNLVLLDVTLDGRFVGDELDFGGRAGTNKGPVTLQGRFRWPQGVMTGTMQLKGEDLLVADTPEYRVLASPDLTVKADASGFEVTGEVLIPVARIAPKDLSTSVGASPDERVVGIDTEDAGPSTLERVRSRVRVALGDSVRVDSQGLKARLGGEVTVTTRPGDVARGNGAIRVVEGEYKAFGQYVKITRGVLRYDDTPLTEPTLDLLAEREIKNEDITVSVNVRGRLDAPFITLTSDPAMSSNEALSYLITGRSLNTLQSGEAASVDRAAEDLALSGGGLLLGSIGTRLGLDEVSVERTGEDDTSVVLGKFLSPKLFVSYGISIAEAINTIKLRYSLNKRWSIMAEGGLEQSADLEFRIER